MQASTHVLLLLAVVAVRLVPSVVSSKSNGRHGSEGDTLVGWAEEDVELRDSRRREDLGVRIRGSVEQCARVQQAGVEEVRRDTAVSYSPSFASSMQLKTYRPDLRVNSPNSRTPLAIAFSMKATLAGSSEAMMRLVGCSRGEVGRSSEFVEKSAKEKQHYLFGYHR